MITLISPQFVLKARQLGWSIRRPTMKPFKRVVIAVMGGTVLALGIALIVLPGPAFLVIPAGLVILAIEFAWAKQWLRAARAIWRGRSQGASLPRKGTTGSVQRCAKFLLRPARRALLPIKKLP